MTAVLCWRGRCAAQGKSPQAGGRSGYNEKQGSACSGNLAAMSEETRGSYAFGVFRLSSAGEGWRRRRCRHIAWTEGQFKPLELFSRW